MPRIVRRERRVGRERHVGVPDDTTDIDTTLATVKDAVTASTTEGAQPSAVAAAARRRAGLEVVDADTIAALRRDATQGRQIKAAAEQQKSRMPSTTPSARARSPQRAANTG